MVTIRIVEGVGTGPTAMSAFDAALAGAGAEQYNLIRLSSVIPPSATLTRVDDVGDIGDVGTAMYAVRAEVIVEAGGRGATGLAWARTEDGAGLFYEASATGERATAAVDEALERGIEHGLALREWSASTRDQVIIEVPSAADAPAAAVILATYGQGTTPW